MSFVCCICFYWMWLTTTSIEPAATLSHESGEVGVARVLVRHPPPTQLPSTRWEGGLGECCCYYMPSVNMVNSDVSYFDLSAFLCWCSQSSCCLAVPRTQPNRPKLKPVTVIRPYQNIGNEGSKDHQKE